MPITQARILSILGAAQDYQQAALQIIDQIAGHVEAVQGGRITEAQAYRLIAVESRPMLVLKYPLESETVLRDELKHFKSHARENSRKAEKLRENRMCERLGIPKPNRGNGSSGALGVWEDRKRRQESPIQYKPEIQQPVIHEAKTPGGKWAERAARPELEITANSDLDFDTEPTAEYIPGEVSPEAKAKIQADLVASEKQQAAVDAYEELDKK